MSAEFDRFLKSNFFGNPFNAWHDGLDTHLLTPLQGDELAQAEEILLKALPNSRAITGLGAIRSQKATEPIRKLIHGTNVTTEAAVALLKISGDTSGIDSLIVTLQNQSSFWSGRMDAAIALRQFRSEKAVQALLAALDDPEKLVRHHAAMSLIKLYGQNHERGSQATTSLALMIMRDADRDAAASELRTMVEQGQL